jgi:hypothetical protein
MIGSSGEPANSFYSTRNCDAHSVRSPPSRNRIYANFGHFMVTNAGPPEMVRRGAGDGGSAGSYRWWLFSPCTSPTRGAQGGRGSPEQASPRDTSRSPSRG